jgi:hypothetical protein
MQRPAVDDLAQVPMWLGSFIEVASAGFKAELVARLHS